MTQTDDFVIVDVTDTMYDEPEGLIVVDVTDTMGP